MRTISFIYRAAKAKNNRGKSRAGDNIVGVEVTLPLPLAFAVKIWVARRSKEDAELCSKDAGMWATLGPESRNPGLT
eukprot:11914443-Heterocapsa_arctica.AAC.1